KVFISPETSLLCSAAHWQRSCFFRDSEPRSLSVHFLLLATTHGSSTCVSVTPSTSTSSSASESSTFEGKTSNFPNECRIVLFDTDQRNSTTSSFIILFTFPYKLKIINHIQVF